VMWSTAGVAVLAEKKLTVKPVSFPFFTRSADPQIGILISTALPLKGF
jgi:hypothetical protein